MVQKQLFYHLTLHKVAAKDGTEISATYADDTTSCKLLIEGIVLSIQVKIVFCPTGLYSGHVILVHAYGE